jgi:hypothetical protein
MLNYEYIWFEKKFKRKAKKWSIEEIHDLYLKCVERNKIRRSILKEVTDYVVTQVPEKNGGRKVYTYSKKGNIMVYTIRYTNEFKSYGTSIDFLRFSDDKTKAREEKIDFIINNEILFKIGEEYKRAFNGVSQIEHIVFKHLWKIVEDKLRIQFKDVKYGAPDVFTISIDGKKYYVKTDEQHRFGYMVFHFGGEVKEDVIEIC